MTSLHGISVGLEEFREIADYAPVMIWRSGPDKLCNFFNRPWLDYTGRIMQQELGNGWTEGVHPDDYERCLSIYTAAFDARDPFSMDYRLRRHDGVYRWILDNGRPFARGGVFAGYFGSCIDIEDRKRLEEARVALVDELNHRVKNMLAGVQALAHLTFRDAAGPASRAFAGRLRAMAEIHDLLTSADWAGADLAAMARLSARTHGAEDALALSGEAVLLPPTLAVALGLALHELFSNAATHGTLARPGGAVTLDWTVEGGRLRLLWREQGGVFAAAPRRGAGLQLLETLAADGGGALSIDFRQDGVVAGFELPLPPPAARLA